MRRVKTTFLSHVLIDNNFNAYQYAQFKVSLKKTTSIKIVKKPHRLKIGLWATF
jgi:hypothetical protein